MLPPTLGECIAIFQPNPRDPITHITGMGRTYDCRKAIANGGRMSYDCPTGYYLQEDLTCEASTVAECGIQPQKNHGAPGDCGR